MSPEHSPRPSKRDHDSFIETQLEAPFSVPQSFLDTLEPSQSASSESLPTPPVSVGNKRDTSPTRSTTGSLTDAGSVTPSYRAQTPTATESSTVATQSAFAVMAGGAAPPKKKAKLTFAEMEVKKFEKEIRDRERAEEKTRKDAERKATAEEREVKERERAEEKARKEAERQANAEEKARKDAEKEAEKKRKEAEKEEKRAAVEAEKAAKEEKRKQKEAEKTKKERSQLKLGNFFTLSTSTKPRESSVESRGRTSMSPAPQSSIISAAVASPMKTPSKPQQSAYEKEFLPFFVKEDTTVAPINRFERDQEASNLLEKTIDSYILGDRSPGRQGEFDAYTLFHLSSHDAIPRGRKCMPVREIMADMSGNGHSSKPIDLTTDSQNSQIKRTADVLKKVPLKFLKFQEDVRPPYRGTYTSRPVTGMTKLARNPLRRDLPDTNYDYDSEAEWIEDEDAEDLKSEGDEEEEPDDDEDMDGFLDDENDETPNSRRMAGQGDLEPISTGLCWEGPKRRNSNVKMIKYRMEIILGMLTVDNRFWEILTTTDPSLKSIDPFSTTYWDPVPVRHSSMEPPRIPLNAMKSTALNTAPKTVKPFFPNSESSKSSPSPLSHPSTSSTSTGKTTKDPKQPKDTKPKKLVPDEDMPAFKAAIEGSDLSKVGLTEVLKKKFPGKPAAMIKATLETVAKRVGVKEADKRWVLL